MVSVGDAQESANSKSKLPYLYLQPHDMCLKRRMCMHRCQPRKECEGNIQ